MADPVRALTVTALSLIPEGDAVSQFDLLGSAQTQKREKLERLEAAMDSIRARYGKGAISPASTSIDISRSHHMPPPDEHHDSKSKW